MCGFQLCLLLLMVTPKYMYLVVCYFVEVASEMVVVFGWVVEHGHVDSITFVWVEFPTPFSLP